MFRSLVKLYNRGVAIDTSETFEGSLIDLVELLGFSIVTPKGIIGAVEDFAVDEPSQRAVFIIVALP